jgi:release factor glutamine methyltransferase
MNIDQAIKKASSVLKKNHIKSAFLDCEILMSKALNKSREFIIMNPNEKINDYEYRKFKKLISSRSKNKPIAYIIGKKSFWKYNFNVSEKVLIPRPDTEILIEQVLKRFKKKESINFLEIGIGSGCIILSILKEKKSFLGRGIDLCKESLKVCKDNANRLNLFNRLKLFKSDIDNFHLGKYDLIISNPPYIKNLDFKSMDDEVVKFEPKIALDGGLDGLSETRKVVKKSSELIKIHGKLILEIAHDQKNEVKKILRNNNFYINEVVKDFANKDRCIISTKI